jgi:hypothetical protein
VGRRSNRQETDFQLPPLLTAEKQLWREQLSKCEVIKMVLVLQEEQDGRDESYDRPLSLFPFLSPILSKIDSA